MTRLYRKLISATDISSLVFFRIFLGLALCGGALRFIAKGWVEDLYIKPIYFFSYYGFEWVQPLSGNWMYFPFCLVALAGLGVALGLFYRFFSVLLFLSFTYIELLDKTNYLNHYYFVSLITFLMIFIPAHRFFSLDVLRKPSLKTETTPFLYIFILRFQLGLVYFFAGIAKINPDWVFAAQPLSIWLSGKTDFPVIGFLMGQKWFAYALSWAGLFFDTTVAFFLSWRKTRIPAYISVVVFHVLTGLLFNIGLFPWIMIGSTLLFFSPDWPKKILSLRGPRVYRGERSNPEPWIAAVTLLPRDDTTKSPLSKKTLLFFSLYILLQLLIPLRHFLYPGNVLWTEEGFRFSWRVMLIEKNGLTNFKIIDPTSSKTWDINPINYLTAQQNKMMSTQPDMILQFAHFLKKEWEKKGYSNIQIFADSYVSLNGRKSRPFLDSKVDLAKEKESFSPKKWILPF